MILLFIWKMYRDNLNFVFVTILCGVVLSEGQLTRPRLRVPDIHQSCEPITEVDICANVGYNKTTFPNYRNQESQQEARNEILQFSPLIQAGCSTALVHLLCAVYVPFCADFFDGQMRIPPCRELCEYVRGGCESMLVKSGFVWPQHLNCSLYPSKGALCFGPDDLTNLQPPRNVSIPGIAVHSYLQCLYDKCIFSVIRSYIFSEDMSQNHFIIIST